MRMRPLTKFLLFMLIVVGLPFYWLVIDNSARATSIRQIDPAALRRLANSVPGDKPRTVTPQVIALKHVPGTFLVANTGLKRRAVSYQSFIIDGPWGTIVVDSGLTRARAEGLNLKSYEPARQTAVEAAMRRARTIVFTGEHPEQMEAMLRLPDAKQLARKALFAPGQRPLTMLGSALPWGDVAEAIEPFDYDGMAAIAPGVVLIRTPGHTPGAQMIYVETQDGRRMLITGPTVPMDRNWMENRGRSRLMSDWISPENRDAARAWIAAVHQAKRHDPGLEIVPGHEWNRTAGWNRNPRLRNPPAPAPAA